MIEHMPLYERHPAPWRWAADLLQRDRWAVFDARGNIILLTRQKAKAEAVASIPEMEARIAHLEEIVMERRARES